VCSVDQLFCAENDHRTVFREHYKTGAELERFSASGAPLKIQGPTRRCKQALANARNSG
jgi:hypothetical protein